MPLPRIETVLVATRATQHYLNRIAAAAAGGPQVDFIDGLVIIGDGGGEIPPISDLLAAGGVTSEVARGSWVQGVNVNPQDAAQVDILCVIPAVDENENPIGPFWVTEYAITDDAGVVCLVGTTAIAKLVPANGGLSDVAFVAAEKHSNGNVVITPPSAAFATILDVINLINSAIPLVEAPLLRETTLLPSGFLRVLLKLRAATQALTGFGRAATDDEFDDGAPAEGGFQFPWVTIAQCRSLLANYFSGVGVTIAVDRSLNLDYAPLSEAPPAATDFMALLRPAAGPVPASYKKYTFAALRTFLGAPILNIRLVTAGGLIAKTAGARSALFIGVGGGGGGGGPGSPFGLGIRCGCPGGGAGEAAVEWVSDLTAINNYQVALGPGGAGGPSGIAEGAPGNNGGPTTVTGILEALGGEGGPAQNSTVNPTPGALGGFGGVAGLLHFPGGASQATQANQAVHGSNGGDSLFGRGGRAGLTDGVTMTPGEDGSGYGSGGGGGVSFGGGSGGAGKPGCVLIVEWSL